MGKPSLIWVDIETTGLNPEVHQILELGICCTDDNLEPALPPFQVLIDPTWGSRHNLQDAWYLMETKVQQMHDKSGLWAELNLGHGMSLNAASGRAWQYLKSWHIDDKTLPCAGSSVHFDRSFLKHHMPEIEKFFHYRNVDVSTIKELATRWYPEIAKRRPAGAKVHRALSDIYDSIQELKYYRKSIFTEIEQRDASETNHSNTSDLLTIKFPSSGQEDSNRPQ